MTAKRSAPQPRTPETTETTLPEEQLPQTTLTAAQKLAILTEYEAYPYGDPQRGALLRRHGLYTSHMSKWRIQRDRGALASLESRPAGRPPQPHDPLHDEVTRLQHEVARLQAQLQKAETVIDIQKKVATLLGGLTPTLANGAA
jgi:transposase-like protein